MGELNSTRSEFEWNRFSIRVYLYQMHGDLFGSLSEGLEYRKARTQPLSQTSKSWRRRYKELKYLGTPAIDSVTCDSACVEQGDSLTRVRLLRTLANLGDGRERGTLTPSSLLPIVNCRTRAHTTFLLLIAIQTPHLHTRASPYRATPRDTRQCKLNMASTSPSIDSIACAHLRKLTHLANLDGGYRLHGVLNPDFTNR
jgi:hypothetical protein